MIFSLRLFLWSSDNEAIGSRFTCSLAFSYNLDDIPWFRAARFYSRVIMIDFWKVIFRDVEGYEKIFYVLIGHDLMVGDHLMQ